jgi:hypothetical protein
VTAMLRLRGALRVLSSERGIALPVTITTLSVTAILGAITAVAAISAVQGSSRDRSVKRSVAAADAGIDIATNRLNKLAPVLTEDAQCVVVGGSGTLTTETVQADGWCRDQSEDLEDHSSYSYRVSARQEVTVDGRRMWQRKIVSVGTVSGVERRAIATVAAPTGNPLFAYGVFSDLDLTMSNSSEIISDVRSNGNVTVNNPAKICGDVVVGPDRELNGDQNCEGEAFEAAELVYLNPVVLPSTNDNDRLTYGDDPQSGDVEWDPGTRVLVVDGGTVTLRGDNYVFCSLHITKGGRVVIEDDGTPVKIYIDAPERCAEGNPAPGSVLFEKKGRIENHGDPWLAQVYMVGSETIATNFSFENNESAEVKMTLYAPNTTFNIWNQGTFVGAVAAKQVTMDNNSEIRYHASVSNVAQDLLELYHRRAWVECAPAATGSEPDSGC